MGSKTDVQSTEVSQWQIVTIPVVAALVFCLGYLQFMPQPENQSASTTSAPTSATSDANSLPLITQPYIPILSPMVDTIAPPLPTTNPTGTSSAPVGPSPVDAADRLQGVGKGQSQSEDKNNSLQATRKELKLNEIGL